MLGRHGKECPTGPISGKSNEIEFKLPSLRIGKVHSVHLPRLRELFKSPCAIKVSKQNEAIESAKCRASPMFELSERVSHHAAGYAQNIWLIPKMDRLEKPVEDETDCQISAESCCARNPCSGYETNQAQQLATRAAVEARSPVRHPGRFGALASAGCVRACVFLCFVLSAGTYG